MSKKNERQLRLQHLAHDIFIKMQINNISEIKKIKEMGDIHPGEIFFISITALNFFVKSELFRLNEMINEDKNIFIKTFVEQLDIFLNNDIFQIVKNEIN